MKTLDLPLPTAGRFLPNLALMGQGHVVVFLLLGAVLGWVAWRWGLVGQGLLLLLPVLWARAPSRLAAGGVWLGYYLAGARDVLGIAPVFFMGTAWQSAGGGLWLMHALLLALPWWVCWTPETGVRRAVRAGVALVLSILPPLGILGWLSPLLAAGALFPGGKGYGLLATAALLVSLPALSRQSLGWVVAVASLVSMLANATYVAPEMPIGWRALSTSLGRFPDTNDREGQRRRQAWLIQQVEEALQRSERVIVLPESIVGEWSPLTQARWLLTAERAKRYGATLLVGADWHPKAADGSSHFASGLMQLGAAEGLIPARVPMPMGVWRPWEADAINTHWFDTGIVRIAGKTALVSICYEDYLVFPVLWGLAQQPEVIVSAANHWFAKDRVATRIQARSIHSWGRLFGLPVVRAVNAGR